MKRKMKIILTYILLSVIFCSSCGDKSRSVAVNTSYEPPEESFCEITALDLDTGEEGAKEVAFSEEDGVCDITEGGTDVLKGDYEGQVRIDAKEYPVHLILENARVKSYHGPALHILSASKVVLTAKEGTENEFQDSPDYGQAGDANGCIYSETDVSINGTGSLLIYGNKKSALSTKGCIKVLEGKIGVQSKKDGIRANDGIFLSPEELEVKSEGNGIVTRKSGKDGKGFLEACGGKISVVAGKNAVLSAGDLFIRDCSLTLKGILSDYSCEGELKIQKGCIANE